MELTAAIAILVAVVAPFLIAIIVRPTWTADQKRNTAIGVSVVLGLIVAVATGRIDQVPATVQAWVEQGVIVVGVIVSLAQGFYQALKGTVTKVETATSPQTPAVAVSSPEPAAAVPTVTVVQTGTTVYEPGNGDPSTKTLS